jgi:hypothetical protein
VWHLWLHLLAWRWWLRDFVLPLLITVAGRAAALPLQESPFPAPLYGRPFVEAFYDIGILLLSAVFIRWSTVWGVPDMMFNVRELAADTQEPKRGFLRQLATEQIITTRKIVYGLTRGTYRVLHPSAMRPWFDRFFQEGGPVYVGVDSHRPKDYMDQYDWYLEAHANSLLARGQPKSDIRVLTVPQAQVTQDFRFAHAAYQNFYR